MSQLDKEFLNLLNEKLVTYCKENKLEEVKACLTLRADVNMRSKDGICHVGLQDQQGRHGKTTDRESQGRHEQQWGILPQQDCQVTTQKIMK